MLVRLPGKVGLLQIRHPAPEDVQLLLQPLHGSGGGLRLGGEELGDPAILSGHGVGPAEGTAAGGHLNAHALPEPLAGDQLHQSHLSAGADMGAAAGAAVRAGPGDNPHLAGQRLLAPVVQLLQLRGGGEGHGNGVVLPDILVGPALHLRSVLRRQLGVEINGHQLMADVEAHVAALEQAAQDSADDVFAAVLLHEVKPAGKVHLPGHALPYGKGSGADVDDLPVPLPDVRDGSAAQQALVRRLAAPLGVEGGPVQDHLPAPLLLPAGEDGPGKFCQKRVLIV